MSDFGEIVGGDSIRFARVLSAPVGKVWAYLTESELLPEWLGSGEIASTVGGKIMLRSGGGPAIHGEVLDYDPPGLLSYTWRVFIPGIEDSVVPESVVRFDLKDEGETTSLTLTQGPITRDYLSLSAAGWHALLDMLAAQLSDAELPDFVETFHRVHPQYETLLT